MIDSKDRNYALDFLGFYVSQPKDADYWKVWNRFCMEAMAGCDVCWTCKMFDVIDCRCMHYSKIMKEPDKQKCPWFQLGE